MGIYRSLDREWQHLGSSPRAVTKLAAWAAQEVALEGYHNPRDMLDDIAVPGRAERAHQVLRALLRLAHDELAARTFLQAILPALRAAPVRAPAEDCCAQRVAATWEAIRVHAGESPVYPARFIVRVAERRLRTEREAVQRRERRLTLLDPDTSVAARGLADSRASADRVAMELINAYLQGTLSIEQVRLLYATAVVGLRANEAGRAARLPGRSVYRHLDAAHAAFAHAAQQTAVRALVPA